MTTALSSPRFSGMLAAGPLTGWGWLFVVLALLAVWGAGVWWARRDRARTLAHRAAWARRQAERSGRPEA